MSNVLQRRDIRCCRCTSKQNAARGPRWVAAVPLLAEGRGPEPSRGDAEGTANNRIARDNDGAAQARATSKRDSDLAGQCAGRVDQDRVGAVDRQADRADAEVADP